MSNLKGLKALMINLAKEVRGLLRGGRRSDAAAVQAKLEEVQEDLEEAE